MMPCQSVTACARLAAVPGLVPVRKDTDITGCDIEPVQCMPVQTDPSSVPVSGHVVPVMCSCLLALGFPLPTPNTASCSTAPIPPKSSTVSAGCAFPVLAHPCCRSMMACLHACLHSSICCCKYILMAHMKGMDQLIHQLLAHPHALTEVHNFKSCLQCLKPVPMCYNDRAA